MLKLIKQDFGVVNAKIFSILDENALSTLEQKNLLEAEYKTYCKFLVVKAVECHASYDGLMAMSSSHS